MTRRLLAGYLTITAIVLVLLEVPLGVVFARLQRATLIAGVRHDAIRIAAFAGEPLTAGEDRLLETVAGDYGRATDGRVVVVDTRGMSRADSEDNPGRNFSSRPEIAAALSGREAQGFRHSDTLGTDLLYVAVPVNSGGNIRGAVRITYPVSFLDGRIRRGWAVLAGLGVAVVGVVTVVSLTLARSVTAPISHLVRAASRLGEGDLSARAPAEAGPHEVRLLTRVFNDTAARLERLVAAQREFVADASHQLRTPLAALRLRLEILQREVPAAAQEDVLAGLAEVHRLSRLVNGLLLLARAEHQVAAPETVDVARVLAERRASWAPLAEEHGVRLVGESEPRALATSTPGHLDQVLDNLLANAIEASPPGTTVRLSASVDSEWVHVHVVDQGRGMDADARAGVFRRLWTTGTKPVGGAGIGLAIAHRLVTSDGGEIELDEAPGGGVDAHGRLRPATRTGVRGGRTRDEPLPVSSLAATGPERD